MTFQAAVAVVMISGPGDTKEDLDEVRRAVREWNADHARERGLVYIPKHFETDVVPLYKPQTDGQLIINDQLTSQSDIVIALFRHRLGSKTPRNKNSGTVEEVDAIAKLGKPAHVYFWNGPIPAEVTDDAQKRKELDRLHKFRDSFNPNNTGLYKRYDSASTLRDHVKRALSDDVEKLVGKNATATPAQTTPAQTVDIPKLTLEITGTVWHLPSLDNIIRAAMKIDRDEEQRFVDSRPASPAFMPLGLGTGRKPATVQQIREWEEGAWERKAELDTKLAAALADSITLTIRSTGTLRNLSVEIEIPDVTGQESIDTSFKDMWTPLRSEDDEPFSVVRMYRSTIDYNTTVAAYEYDRAWQQDGDDVVIDVEIEDLRKKRMPESWDDLVTLMIPVEKNATKKVHYTWRATADNTGEYEYTGSGTIDVISAQEAAKRALEFVERTDED